MGGVSRVMLDTGAAYGIGFGYGVEHGGKPVIDGWLYHAVLLCSKQGLPVHLFGLAKVMQSNFKQWPPMKISGLWMTSAVLPSGRTQVEMVLGASFPRL